jgi:hypothetical protein
MAKYVFLIMVNPVEGQDATLNAWLDDHHIPEVLETQGFKRCTRYQLAPEGANPKATRYMHQYEIETDDLAAVQAALGAGNDKRTPLTPAVDLSTMFTAWYRLKD